MFNNTRLFLWLIPNLRGDVPFFFFVLVSKYNFTEAIFHKFFARNLHGFATECTEMQQKYTKNRLYKNAL